MTQFRKRLDRINKVANLAEILHGYGYQVNPHGGEREQQFSCDLHGDGSDGKPSARLYGHTNSTYCFACAKSRDAVEYVKIKENLSYGEACRKLEKKYDLEPLEWEADERSQRPEEIVREALKATGTPFPTLVEEVRVLLNTLTHSQTTSFQDTMRLWELFDEICWKQEHEKLSTEKATHFLLNMKEKVHLKL